MHPDLNSKHRQEVQTGSADNASLVETVQVSRPFSIDSLPRQVVGPDIVCSSSREIFS